jgi:hypothetical protein
MSTARRPARPVARPLPRVAALLPALLLAACGASRSYSPPRTYAHGSIDHDSGGETIALAARESPGSYRVARQATPTGPAHAAPVVGRSEVRDQGEMIVIEGWIRVGVDDVPGILGAIRDRVREQGGRVVDEQVSGTSPSWHGTIKVRIAPELVEPFLEWLGGQGEVGSRRIQGTDVSKEYFDQELALKNLELTMSRLQALLQREGIETKDVLEIEKEMTRIRGEIEGHKGRLRWLSDKVALATLEITLTTRKDAVFAPSAKFRPGPRASLLLLPDEEPGERFRLGLGASLHFHRAFTAEVDLFPSTDGRGRALLATVGGAAYSDFLGRGKRRYLNPFLGLRLGYGHVGRASLAIAAEAGVELFKHEFLLVEGAVRGLGLIHGDGADAAVQAGVTINLPF